MIHTYDETTAAIGPSGERSDLSFSSDVENLFLRKLILLVETVTGRPRLVRMADGYDREVASGRDFWEVMQDRYGITLDFVAGGPQIIPKTGPAVVVANHPYGILDSLALGRTISMVRKDFKIVANSVFYRVTELNDHLIPISFAGGREAVQMNLNSRKEALDHLANGGVVAIYPGGCVSTSARPFVGRPIDPQWKNFTAKLVTRSQAPVIPIYFEGCNSRLFQVASHVSQSLRSSLLIREFGARVNGAVTLAVGAPIDRSEIEARRKNPTVLMDYLRTATYGLSSHPFGDLSYGWNGE